MKIKSAESMEGNNKAGLIGSLLTDYATSLLACGATSVRIEKNITRISRHFNIDCDMAILPKHILLNLNSENGEQTTLMGRIKPYGLNFEMNARLSALSWEIADNRISLVQALTRYHSIVSTPGLSKWIVLLLASLANASFCRLFGGDWISMAIVFIATLDGFYLKQLMLSHQHNIWLTTIVSSFAAATIGSAGYILKWGDTPELALGTSILFLVPGVPFINSISDMIEGHFLCAFSRFTQAFLLTICLSIGLCISLIMMNLQWF